jgi:hypothetical protein
LAYWAGEPVEIGLSVSHFGASPLEGASLVWALGKAGGALELPALAPGEVRDVGTIGFEAPSAPTPPVLVCRILLPGDHEVARCVQPFRFIEPTAELAARVYSEDADLAAWLTAQGYSTGEPYDLRVVINSKDKVPLQATNPNEHVLLIATGESQILPGIQVERRQGTPRAGEWASSFMWAGPELSGSEIGGLLDFTWHDVIPQHVITGVPREDVLAGLFVGWVHMAAALAARVESLTVTTFPVVPPGDSPLRSDLLHRLIAAALA